MAGVKGRSGRKRIPTVLRAGAGAPESALPADEPTPSRTGITRPDYLSKEACKAWDKAVKQLDECGIMTVVDEAALAHYCEQFVTWQTALSTVRKKGMLVTNERTGNLRPNPAIKIANDAYDRLLKMMVEFGMTPSSRARVKIRSGFSKGAPGSASGSGERGSTNRFALIKGGA